MNSLKDRLAHIKCLICDIDGVLSDGYLYIANSGDAMKAFHVHDGMGIKLLLHSGIDVAVITTCRSQIIDTRMEQLGITHYFKAQTNKIIAYEQLKQRLGFTDHEFAYIGDDLPDLPVMRQVGFAVAVGNAVNLVREYADWQTQKPGGHGAVRELCDLILHAQNKTELALENYLKYE